MTFKKNSQLRMEGVFGGITANYDPGDKSQKGFRLVS
jgi:hypothetical protein